MKCDVVIVGAGSVGVPTALMLARRGVRVVVVDSNASAGRGQNRAAIGGIRATHSEPAKMALALASIDVFSGWQYATGDDIGWRQGGYTFVAYTDEHAALLQGVVEGQKARGLDIRWVGPERVRALVPGIVNEDLRGGTWSPGDGSASPLRAIHSFRVHAEAAGVVFRFQESVREILMSAGRVHGVRTDAHVHDADGDADDNDDDDNEILAPVIIDAAGASAAQVAALAGVTLPVVPDSHEAGVTEPVARFLEPMVVDIRPAPGSKNFYFYQDADGQVVFCITPEPPILGTDSRSTSVFLPMIAQRMVALLPRLANLKIRRVWRGLYPMTPDGSPLLGWVPGVEGLFVAAGMCGQGFMLGPGIGALVARTLTGAATAADRDVLRDLRVDRAFAGDEALR